MKKLLSFALSLCMALTLLPGAAMAAGVTATKTASKVTVDGAAKSFDAYTIAENNYFKLRDIASVLSGTGKQFEVTWDGAKNAINLVSGKPYTAVGGEMTPAEGTTNKTATLSTSKIYVDGKEVTLTAYAIDGNNYFKLRDLGATFNFGVEWDGAANSIAIKSTVGYTPETPVVKPPAKPSGAVMLPASDFEYTKENGGVTINLYTGDVQTGVVEIPAYIEGLPVLKLEYAEPYAAGAVFSQLGMGVRGKYTGIILPETLVELGKNVFANLYELKSLTIPDSVKKIGEQAFFALEKVETIYIGAAVEEIHMFAFRQCEALKEYTVSGANTFFVAQNGVIYSKDMATLVRYPNGRDGASYAIPATVTKISAGAFSDVGYDSTGTLKTKFLAAVNIPEGVTTIGDKAFDGANSIRNISIPSTITAIEEWSLANISGNCQITIAADLPFNLWPVTPSGSSITPAGIYTKAAGELQFTKQ